MMFRFDRAYIGRNRRRVAMFVANGVVNDSRVVKTAQSVKKLGYDLTLFGVGAAKDARELHGYNFRVLLLPRPSLELSKLHGATDCARIDFRIYSDLIAAELAKALKNLKPSILHTHDMLGLAVASALHRHAPELRYLWIHDIHEYVAGLTELPETTRLFFYDVEKRWIHDPDYLTCVSPVLIEILIKDHGLQQRPRLVLNAPRRSDFDRLHPSDVRSALCPTTDDPLLVYSGNVKPVRGIDTIVHALPQMPRAHLAVITNSRGSYREGLAETTKRLGVGGRVHFHPYVPFMNVTSFLRTATVGIHPIRRYPNAEIALPNKLFEYIHAGIPSIVSDNKAMSEFVTEKGCGKAFRTDDAGDLAGTVQSVLAMLNDDKSLRSRLDALATEYSWETQEATLAAIYSEIDGKVVDARAPRIQNTSPRILHLPTASAGQPATFAATLRRRGCQACSLRIGEHQFKYEADIEVDSFKHSSHSNKMFQDILDNFDILHYHVRPLYMASKKYPAGLDLLIGRASSRKVFFHFRGSEIRMETLFKRGSPYNYVDENPEGIFTKFDEQQQRRLLDYVRAVCNGVFVVDPELQTYVPDAMIVPRVIDLDKWTCVGSNPQGSLKVVHAPSRREFKGTDAIIGAVHDLVGEGISIELKLVESMPNDQAVHIYREADVIVDQLRIGWYGVLAVEGMALGKAVVSFVRDDLKHYLPYPFPMAIASPDNFREVLRSLAQDHELVRDIGRRGREYVEQIHAAEQNGDLLLEIYDIIDRPISATGVWSWLEQGLTTKAPKRLQKPKHPRVRRGGVVLLYERARRKGLIAALKKAYKKTLRRRANRSAGARDRTARDHSKP